MKVFLGAFYGLGLGLRFAMVFVPCSTAGYPLFTLILRVEIHSFWSNNLEPVARKFPRVFDGYIIRITGPPASLALSLAGLAKFS